MADEHSISQPSPVGKGLERPSGRDAPAPTLEPCPFCGGAATIGIASECGEGAYVVSCTTPTCLASSKVIFASKNDPRELLFEVWNRRPLPGRGDGYDERSTDAELAAQIRRLLNAYPPATMDWPLDILQSAATRLELAAGKNKILDERMQELRRAQSIINGLRDYRERLLTCHTDLEPTGRVRIVELSNPPRDDHDRAVLLLAADYERLLQTVVSAVPSSPLAAPAVRSAEREVVIPSTSRMERMEEALREIAQQKTMVELEGELDGCDFDYAYDKMIETARRIVDEEKAGG